VPILHVPILHICLAQTTLNIAVLFIKTNLS
jgi:hypothetical protein